jgi:hypothetical protein
MQPLKAVFNDLHGVLCALNSRCRFAELSQAAGKAADLVRQDKRTNIVVRRSALSLSRASPCITSRQLLCCFQAAA